MSQLIVVAATAAVAVAVSLVEVLDKKDDNISGSQEAERLDLVRSTTRRQEGFLVFFFFLLVLLLLGIVSDHNNNNNATNW